VICVRAAAHAEGKPSSTPETASKCSSIVYPVDRSTRVPIAVRFRCPMIRNEDAGPSHDTLYHDANYVFGRADARLDDLLAFGAYGAGPSGTLPADASPQSRLLDWFGRRP
jgi:hypothetical protein